MRMRHAPALIVGLVGALALAACAPATAPDPPGPSPEPPAELVLPPDAVLGLVGVATAPNGATADVAIVVHASLPYFAPEAADATTTTLEWCVGEVDETVLSGRGYTFTAVDVALTPRDGSWPDDLTLLVNPSPHPEFGSTLAAGPGLRQVDASDDDSFDGSVPHCRQPAVLDGAGSGTVYLGIPSDITGANDAESFTAWARHDFGLSAALPGDLGSSPVVFSACAARITALGEEFGAPSATWTERFDESRCVVGGFELE